jgi:type 1 glutamine amidotransferase
MRRFPLRTRTVALVAAVSLAAVTPAIVAPASDVPHVVVFSGTFGYRHGGIAKMAAAIEHIAAMTGAFTVERTEDPAAFTAELYERADAVLFLQTTGAPPFSDAQRSAFLRSVSCGDAFIGVHAAADSGDWAGYTDLIGAKFAAHGHFGSVASYQEKVYEDAGHPGLAPADADVPAVTEVTINVEDQTSPATAPWHGRDTFRMSDELYQYQQSPRGKPGVTVLLSLDNESDYWPLAHQVPNPRVIIAQRSSAWFGYKDVTPIAWTKGYGAGRVFYTNLGHNPSTWDRPDFQAHLLGGIRWATEVRADPVCIAA